MSSCKPANEAIPTVYEAFGAAIERQDSAALATFYTVDSKVVPAGGDVISGIDAIPGYFDALFELGVKRCSFEFLDIDQHGDIAIEIGRVTLCAEGGVEIDTLKYLVVWKCENGNWLVHRDILTIDKPAS